MPVSNAPPRPRRFGGAEATRAVICVLILAVFAGLYWLGLPSLQAKFLPEAPGGEGGPWIVRPILALRFGAMAIMSAATLPFVLRPLRRVWVSEDEAVGTKYDPLHGRLGKRVAVFIKGTLLFAIYGAALLFYLLSWVVVEPDGIRQRLPWTTLHHSYEDIASLKAIPEGGRIERLDYDGPYYSIGLKSGRTVSLSLDNEGATAEELQAMADLISAQSGLPWQRWEDSEP